MPRPLLLAACLLVPMPAPAQTAEAPADTGELRCAYQRKNHPEYILWICNPEGTAPSADGSLLWLRTNAAGAEVMTPVWHGSSLEMVERAEDIIASHRRDQEGCQHYIHFARADGREMRWNVGTSTMLSEWQSADRRVTHGGSETCYTHEPGSADFVIVWSERADRLPYAFTVQIPSTRDETQVPARKKQHPALVARPEPAQLALGVYRVDPGMDNSILRLGLSIYATAAAGTRTSGLPSALAFLRTLPR